MINALAHAFWLLPGVTQPEGRELARKNKRIHLDWHERGGATLYLVGCFGQYKFCSSVKHAQHEVRNLMVSFDSLFFTTYSYALAGFCRGGWRCRQEGFWDLQRDLCSISTEFLLLLSNLVSVWIGLQRYLKSFLILYFHETAKKSFPVFIEVVKRHNFPLKKYNDPT